MIRARIFVRSVTKTFEEREVEPEPSEKSNHVDGKEVDCNTNHIGDGWRTSFAEDTLRQPRSQERT